MYIKIRKVFISPLFIAIVIYFCITDDPLYIGILLACALLHEFGHIAFAKYFGIRVKAVYFNIFGICIKFNKFCYAGYKTERSIAFAGPLFNILAAAGLLTYVYFFGVFEKSGFIVAVNLLFALCNLIPIEVTDGGRILKCSLMNVLEPFKADRIMKVTGVCFTSLLFLLAIIVVIKSGYNLSLMLIAVFALIKLLSADGGKVLVLENQRDII